MTLRASPAKILPSMNWSLQFFTGASGTTRTVANQDGDRAGLAFVFQPPAGVVINHEWRLLPGQAPQSDRGWILNSSNPRLLFRFQDYGPLVCQEWQASIIASGPGLIYPLGVYWFRFQPRIR